MNWSRLKKQVRLLLCDEARDRVDFHKAVYRNSWESAYDRAWITIDGGEVCEFSHGAYTMAWRQAERRVTAHHPEADPQTRAALVDAAVMESGVESTGFLSESLHRYLEMPIAMALCSTNPVIRAFARLDRRTGVRTLQRLTPGPDEHPLVRKFHELRTDQLHTGQASDGRGAGS